MLLDKEVEIKGHGKNRKFLESLGFIYRNREVYMIQLEDLWENSAVKVKVQCDYCGESTQKEYWSFLKGREIIEKDCCKNVECMKKKREDVSVAKYGVTNINKLDHVKEKIKQTNLDKYGVENVFQVESHQNKHKITIEDKYGVENVSQIKDVKNKKEMTTESNFGYKNPMSSPIVREKVKNTMLDRYGYEYAIQIPVNREKMLKALSNRMISPEGVRYSYQQLYICELFDGELNYSIRGYNLDIAFPNEKIYIEFDGSGHNLSVQMGSISEKDFSRKEIIRNEYTKREGWKCIRVISLKDKIPSDETMQNMIKFANDYFRTGRSWITFDIDNGIVKGFDLLDSYEFGELFSRYKIKNKLSSAI